jgi:protoporphyrinogen/coproporphyrinogen III oxidase
MTERVAVVGGGVAGLTAAHGLRQALGPTAQITVFEAASRIGGKVTGSEVGGVVVDEGAESLLTRRPEAIDLVGELGLADSLEASATGGASVFVGGRLRRLPTHQLMGIPTDLRELAAGDLLSVPALLRLPLDFVLPRTSIDGDVSLGEFVTKRLGREVVDRLVEPLLGGVYAGHADDLSLDATLPQLGTAVRMQPSLLHAARDLQRSGTATATQPFAALRGGMWQLPAAIAEAAHATVRTGAAVSALRRSPGGWQLTVGSGRGAEQVFADAVVIAVPAGPAAALLQRVAPAAAAELAQVEYASVALVTYVLPRSATDRLPTGSGYLVPPSEARVVKAATFSSAKWGWLATQAPDRSVIRCSVGRFGETRDLEREDAELGWVAFQELQAAVGPLGDPLATRVTRWDAALPQYRVGHLARVARIRAAVARHPALAVCGAAYDGVGIPASISSAHTAVREIVRATSRAQGHRTAVGDAGEERVDA